MSVHRSADFDATGHYRYRLTRHWQLSGPRLTIIMLNPSQANAMVDDPTVRRCMGLAHQWGFGAITVVNLFAFCTAYPRQLKQVQQPIGPKNDQALWDAAATGDRVLLAWGNHGSLHQRDQAVLRLVSPFTDKWCCLGRNRTGQPRHPLYTSRDTVLQSWGKFIS